MTWDNNINLGALRDRIAQAIDPALTKGIEHLKTVVTPLVPVETGNLVGSGGVKVVGHVASLTYAGPYALYQHEGFYYRHERKGAPLTHTHGQSFFLEQPMVAEKDNILRVVADELWSRI